MKVTFVGHRDAPENTYEPLYKTLRILIQNEGANDFYVGQQGSFDRMALRALRELKKTYPYIRYQVVLAYMPTEKNENEDADFTLLPVEVATAPRRFAIDRRNRWMIENSDIVIAYVKRSCGGAATFRKRAIARGKRIIDLFP